MGTDRGGISALQPNGGQNYPTELTQNRAIRNDLAIPTESQAPSPSMLTPGSGERAGGGRRSEAGKQKEWQWQYFTIKPISVSQRRRPRRARRRSSTWPLNCLPEAEGEGRLEGGPSSSSCGAKRRDSVRAVVEREKGSLLRSLGCGDGSETPSHANKPISPKPDYK